LVGCSDSVDEPILLYSLDRNEIVFEDYKANNQVSRLPPFADPVHFENLYDYAISKRDNCIQTIENVTATIGNQTENKVPPDCSIYPKHDVVPGEKNNFICFVTNFYPPHIKLRWMRNGVFVTEGVYISQFSINSDGTFNIFSTLTTTPDKGDRFSCMVEHQALDSPHSITWDESMEPPRLTPSVTPTVVFAVGILGLATGIFFVIKG
ncbi:hypothetical protein C0J45_13830, partial [Silurus meridionalis]